MQTRHLLTALLIAASPLLAQQVSQPEPPATAPVTTTGAAAPSDNPKSPDDIVNLSVFTVTGARDTGYAGLSTTAGSRVKTDLKDIAASIDPFTKEFLDDIGAVTIDDIMAYAGNAEGEYEDAQQGFMNLASRGADTTDERYRIRGVPMTRTVDYFPYPMPVDTYNTTRAEIASGANAILFGLGAAGGVVNFTTTQADAQRNRLRVRATLGAWTSPAVSGIPYSRAEFDYNLVLMPQILAVRLLALYENGTNNSWRKWMTGRNRRINPALYIKPLPDTTINARFEAGRVQQSTSFSWNLADQLTAWLALPQDQRVMQGFGATNKLPNVTINNLSVPTTAQDGNNNNLISFVTNAAPGEDPVINMSRAFYSTNQYASSPTKYRLSPDLSSYYYNPVGPGGLRDQKFDNFTISLEQRLGPVNLELAFHHDSLNGIAHAPASPTGGNSGQEAVLLGDPNSYLAAGFTGDPQNTGVVKPNPRAGGLYIEDPWWLQTSNQRNNVARLTAEYTLNLKHYGTHRLVGFLERAYNEQFKIQRLEEIVDESQNVLAALTRRQYVTPGDFSTYYDGDWRTPFPGFEANGHIYRAAYVAASNNFVHTKRTTNSMMLVLQSFFLDNKIVTTIGGRIDDVTGERENLATAAPGDPAVLNKTLAIGEAYPNGNWTTAKHRNPTTFSTGIVYHIINQASAFFNYSTNRGVPANSAKTVLAPINNPPPYDPVNNPLSGPEAPLSQGRTIEYGIILDPLGDGKITLRVSRFDTMSLHDSSLSQTSGLDDNSYGSGALQNIQAALYNTYGPDLFNQMPQIPHFNSGMADSKANGYEATLTANPTKNLTLRAVFSYTQREKENIFGEIVDYCNANIPAWLALADNAPGAPMVGALTLGDYVRNQLYGPGGVRENLATQMFQQSGPMGGRPYKFNITARYKLDPLVKGLALGGALRYAARNYYPDPAGSRDTLATAPTDGTLGLTSDLYGGGNRPMMRGNSLTGWDTFLTYKRKLFGGRTNMTLQLNIKNVFNQCVITIGRTTVDNTLTRVYLTAPRAYRLSATFDF